MDTILGWTMRQFGSAKVHHRKVTAEDLPATFKGMVDLTEWWRLRRVDEPLATKLAWVETEADMEWAAEAWAAAQKEFYDSMRAI